jgi:sigma-B regulation protein RsbU (phosphoserine phosphatase)
LPYGRAPNFGGRQLINASEAAGTGTAEWLRLEALANLHLLDTPAEERFDRITRMARELFNVPIAAVRLIDEDRVFTKSPPVPGRTVMKRRDSICDTTIHQVGVLVVPDASMDPRFAHLPPVTGASHIRFYAGRPLSVDEGQRVGSLCLFDTEPRGFDDAQRELLDEMGLWVERELREGAERDRAAEVQQGLLPFTRPLWPDYDFAGICVPVRNVGGDFYSWQEVDGGVELTLADVMGKGTAAAILAATIRAAFQAHSGKDVAAAVRDVNSQLENDLGATGTFATLFHARLDAGSGRLDYADAGHGLTIIVRADGTVERLSAVGLPLGITGHGSWIHHTATLNPGDMLVSFTDGLMDLYDGPLASVDHIAGMVRASVGPRGVIRNVSELTRLGGSGDDVTVIAIQRTGP